MWATAKLRASPSLVKMWNDPAVDERRSVGVHRGRDLRSLPRNFVSCPLLFGLAASDVYWITGQSATSVPVDFSAEQFVSRAMNHERMLV
jgi:hypothetical protein